MKPSKHEGQEQRRQRLRCLLLLGGEPRWAPEFAEPKGPTMTLAPTRFEVEIRYQGPVGPCAGLPFNRETYERCVVPYFRGRA